MKRFAVLGLSVTLVVLMLAFLMSYSMGSSRMETHTVVAAKSPEGAQSVNANRNWLVEVVDTVEGRYISLVLDKANRPHLAYFDPASGDLKYARLNGTVWQTETVDAQGSVGWYASLALDEFDQPHISYYDATNADLKYTSFTGSSWQTEIVDSLGDVGSYAALALDQSNRPHVSYYDATNYAMKYAWQTGGTWQTEVITTEVIRPRSTSLALNGAGQPRVSYNSCLGGYRATDPCLLYFAWLDGIQWQIELATGVADHQAFALDKADRPHLISSEAYYGPYLILYTHLEYAWRDQTGWHSALLEETVGQVAIALDSADYPHILNYNDIRPRDTLQYRWYDGAIWHIEDVDNVGVWNSSWFGGDDARNGSLALDTSGRPHIAYYDATAHQIKYAQRWPMALSKEAEPQDGLYQGDTLNYTLTFDAPDLHVNLSDSLPSGIAYVSDSISSTLSPPAVYSPSINAVIWEGTLPSSNTQTIHFQVIANGLDTGSLSLPIANAAWLTDIDNGRSLVATVIVNGFKAYLPIISKN